MHANAADDLPLSLELRVDGVCRQFEAEWRAGRPPAVEPYLSGWDGPPAAVLRAELERIDTDYRKRSTGPAPAAADRVGEFRLLRRIGRGGMGTVYEALQESLGRHVALKLISQEALLDPVRLERFRREAKAAARLHHTNIVPVFGTGEAAGRHFYVMQFIAGRPLDAVIADLRRARETAHLSPGAPPAATHTFDPPAADTATASIGWAGGLSSTPSEGARRHWTVLARLAAQVADALAYAHAQGVLHRDIKPANLLLDPHGTVWVTDFGLAKAHDADDLTNTGDVIGTIRYMAPERFDGAGDHRADVYALGLTLYELLTLQPAFRSPNRAKLVEQTLAADPPKPRVVDPAIPRDLETVVLKAIARHPTARYPTAAAMADDLRRFVEDRPIRARRATPAEQAWRWCRRNPAVAGLLAAVVLALAAGAAASAGFAVRADDARQKAVEREKDAIVAQQDALSAQREGQEKLYQSLLAEGRASRYSRRVGQRFGTLETVKKAVALARELGKGPGAFDELRNLAVSALALPDVRVIGEYAPPSGDLVILDPSDPDRHAYRTPDGTLVAARFSDRHVIDRLTGVDGLTAWAFSPDGLTVYLAAADGLSGWEVGRSSRRRLAPPSADSPVKGDDLTLTRGGRRLLRLRSDATGTAATVYDLPAGRVVFSLRLNHRNGAEGKWAAALSPDGRRLAAADGGYKDETRHTLRVFDVDTGGVLQTFAHDEDVLSPVWMPDGTTLIVGLWDHTTVLVYDCLTGKKLRDLRGHRGGCTVFRVSTSGQLLYSWSNWGGLQAYWHPQTGEVLLQTHTHSGVEFTTPLTDGRIAGIEVAGDKFRLWAVEPSPVFRSIVPDPTGKPLINLRDIAVHPAGRLTACGTTNGVCLLDLHTGAAVARLPISSAMYVRFDPVTGDLFSHGWAGLFRWPVRIDGPTVAVGPPRYLHPPYANDSTFDLSADGRTVVASRFFTARVFDSVDTAARLPRVIGPLDRGRIVTISPDGRWVAGRVEWNGDWLYFDARTGAPAAKADFDRAGVKTLYTSRHRPGELTVELLRPGSDQPLVAFEHADSTAVGQPVFSPDRGRVIINSEEKFVLHDWDLRALRRHLRALELDWDGPEFPPAAPRDPAEPPLSVRVTGAELATDLAARAEFTRVQAALALRANPVDADAHYQLGLLALAAADLTEAEKRFAAALVARPGHEGALSKRAHVSFLRGRFAEAVADADRALASGSGDTFTRLLRGKALAALGRHGDAIAEFTDLLRYTPKNWELLTRRAASRRVSGDPGAATADEAAAAAGLENSMPAALSGSAWRLVVNPDSGVHEPELALVFATKAVAMAPGDATKLNTLGVVQYYSGLYDEAVTTLRKSLAAGKGKYDGYDLYHLAMCHARLGETGTASDEFGRAEAWTEKHTGDLDPLELGELKQFRAGAAALLGKK